MNSLTLTPRQPTVQQMVLESPARARVFEKYGIDYCCRGGGKSLTDACRATDAAFEALDSDLQQIDELLCRKNTEGYTLGELRFNEELRMGMVRNWKVAPLDSVAEHIVNVHHATLRSELPRLSRLIDGIVQSHGADYHNMGEVQFVLHKLRDCLEGHMNSEEDLLYSLYHAQPGFAEPRPVQCGTLFGSLEREHAYIALSMGRLRALTNGFAAPEKTCVTFRVLMDGLADLEADLQHHLSEEREMLFIRAAATSH